MIIHFLFTQYLHKIVIKPKLSANAMYDPVKNILYLSKDPRKVSSKNSLSVGETIWHELTHKIEAVNNDIGVFVSYMRKEIRSI